MSFYEELEREFKSAGIEGQIIAVPEELKPNPKDLVDLEKRIAIRVDENEVMLAESMLLADKNLI